MKKKAVRKLRLSTESLYQLDSLGDVAGGFAATQTCSVNYSCPITYCTCPQRSAQC